MIHHTKILRLKPMKAFTLMQKIALLTLMLSVSSAITAQVPTVQDCLGAIPVCQDIYIEENTYVGTGNYPNEIYEPPGQCTGYCPNSCMDGEQNSVWYVFTVQQSGNLRLTIDPDVNSDDYDWAIYDISTLRCDDIYGNPLTMQKSCNAAGGAGFQGSTGISSQMGGSGSCNNCGATNKWNADMYVEAGKTFVLVMCNWAGAGAQGGYILDFSDSDAIIYDDVRPELEDVLEDEIHCGVDYIIVDFSENVECSSVNPGDFLVDGPGGPYTVIDVHGQACDLGGDYESRYTLTLDREINEDGLYSVELIALNFIYDACNNVALGNTITFNVDLGAPEIDESSMVISAATCGLTNGSITGIEISGTPPYDYQWTDSNGNIVGTDLDLIDVPGEEYTLTVMDEMTCSTTGGPYEVIETGAPDIIETNMVITQANYGANNGSIVGIEVEGNGPFQFTWRDETNAVAGTTLDLTNIYSGYYSLETIDVNDCDTITGPYFVPQIGGPLSVTVISSPSVICIGESSTLNAMTTGGAGNYTFNWVSDPPGFSTDVQNPTVSPLVTTTYTVTVSDGFNIVTESATVTVNELPMALAGNNQVIPYGISTSLHGNGSGGSEEYLFHWEPEDMLINASSQNPATVNLYESTTFTLVVTDAITGCVSESDVVTVTLSGGPLNATAMAMDPEICKGESTELVAVPGGGNFPHYTYEWKHNNVVISDDSMLTVTPAQSETYHLKVFDGYNESEDEVTVNVLPLPEFHINAGQEEIIVCPFDTVLLAPSSTDPSWEYYWSNGMVTPDLKVGTTGIGFDVKEYSLTITTAEGCSFTSEVTVIFDFAACLGVEEVLEEHGVSVYPNPASGKIMIRFEDATGLAQFNLMDYQGRAAIKKMPGRNLHGPWETSLDLSSLAKGGYVLEIRFQDKVLHSKVIVE